MKIYVWEISRAAARDVSHAHLVGMRRTAACITLEKQKEIAFVT